MGRGGEGGVKYFHVPKFFTRKRGEILPENNPHEWHLKTESCYFNYGPSILSPIAISHTFISRPGDKSIVASQKLESGFIRFSSLFLSSLGALGPLVCSSALTA